MSEFPYEQVRQFQAASYCADCSDERIARNQLHALHEAGITVTFPEPRYYVEFNPKGIGDLADVVDRKTGRWAARFDSGTVKDASRAAQDVADRLNREATDV